MIVLMICCDLSGKYQSVTPNPATVYVFSRG